MIFGACIVLLISYLVYQSLIPEVSPIKRERYGLLLAQDTGKTKYNQSKTGDMSLHIQRVRRETIQKQGRRELGKIKETRTQFGSVTGAIEVFMISSIGPVIRCPTIFGLLEGGHNSSELCVVLDGDDGANPYVMDAGDLTYGPYDGKTAFRFDGGNDKNENCRVFNGADADLSYDGGGPFCQECDVPTANVRLDGGTALEDTCIVLDGDGDGTYVLDAEGGSPCKPCDNTPQVHFDGGSASNDDCILLNGSDKGEVFDAMPNFCQSCDDGIAKIRFDGGTDTSENCAVISGDDSNMTYDGGGGLPCQPCDGSDAEVHFDGGSASNRTCVILDGDENGIVLDAENMIYPPYDGITKATFDGGADINEECNILSGNDAIGTYDGGGSLPQICDGKS